MIEAAIACGARTLVLPECGHAYGALRWQGANVYGKPLPFQVLHISEYLAENVRNGQLNLKKLNKTAAYHDPCQVSRRGGRPPRRAKSCRRSVSSCVKWSHPAT